jgi:hypothetical protein
MGGRNQSEQVAGMDRILHLSSDVLGAKDENFVCTSGIH